MDSDQNADLDLHCFRKRMNLDAVLHGLNKSLILQTCNK